MMESPCELCGDVFKQGVDGGGFAGAGGTGDEEHAGIGAGEAVEGFEGARRQAQIIERAADG